MTFAEAVFVSFAGLACCCSLSIVVTAFVFPSLRQRLFFQIILLISMCDVIGAIGAMMGFPPEGSTLCNAQAVLISGSYKASWMWTTVLSYQLYCVVIKGSVGLSYRTMHLLTWPPALLMTLLPLTQLHYGRGGPRDPHNPSASGGYKTGWCDLGGHNQDYYIWKLVSWELELVVCFCTLLYFAVKIRFSVARSRRLDDFSKRSNDEEKENHGKLVATQTDSGDGMVDSHFIGPGKDSFMGSVTQNPLVITRVTAAADHDTVPVLTETTNSTSASDIAASSGMDVLKMKVLIDSVGSSNTKTVSLGSQPVQATGTSGSNSSDCTDSDQHLLGSVTRSGQESRVINNMAHTKPVNSPIRSSQAVQKLPKTSSARKTANMISSTLYLYPMCVAVTWGPFLLYSLLFEYGNLLKSSTHKSYYDNLLFCYLSGLAVQSGSLLTVIFFAKSKFARDEWMKLFRKWSWQYGLWLPGRRHRWRTYSMLSASDIDEEMGDERLIEQDFQSYSEGQTTVGDSLPGYERASSVASSTYSRTQSSTTGPGGRNYRRSSTGAPQRPYAPPGRSVNATEQDHQDNLPSGHINAAMNSPSREYLSNESLDGSSDRKDEYDVVNENENTYDDDDDDTLILGRRTEPSFSEVFIASFSGKS